MTCLICEKSVDLLGTKRLCFDCWRMLGMPKNNDECVQALLDRPNLVDELEKRSLARGSHGGDALK